jgi:hypothetical protein
MSRLSPSQLQAALDSLTKANNRAQLAREKIMEHCQAVYGVEPGDIDNDAFIDACDGANGMSAGMSVEDFDKSMREAMDMIGISMPDQ